MNENYTLCSISVDCTAVKLFTSKLLVIIEIVTKHCWHRFLGTSCMFCYTCLWHQS